jgi:hypothetical protein
MTATVLGISPTELFVLQLIRGGHAVASLNMEVVDKLLSKGLLLLTPLKTLVLAERALNVLSLISKT